MNDAGIEAFGGLAVSSMALCYALEPRAAVFVLLFALSCLASSFYAVLIRSWPFAVVELLWAGVAFRRWAQHRRSA